MARLECSPGGFAFPWSCFDNGEVRKVGEREKGVSGVYSGARKYVYAQIGRAHV